MKMIIYLMVFNAVFILLVAIHTIYGEAKRSGYRDGYDEGRLNVFRAIDDLAAKNGRYCTKGGLVDSLQRIRTESNVDQS